jgi:hypothetical protein
MFGKFRKKDPLPARALAPFASEEADESFRDEDVPSFEAPHLTWLHDSTGGPYYVAPDSAPPLPSGMWKELDPEIVTKEAERIDEFWGTDDWHMDVVDPDIRASLDADGALGRRVIEVLEGRSADSG